MKRYILALDQGTTSSRAVIYDLVSKRIINTSSKSLRQIYPNPGWVEHDAEEIWLDQLEVIHTALKDLQINVDEIACLGITNQRETIVVWNKYSGKPIYHAVVWQCRRSSSICEELSNKGLKDIIQKKTGLVIDAYFSGTKIKWILENVPNAREMAEKGDLLAGTIDTWLVWKLTGGKTHITDFSNASRTMLFNINTLEWDEDLLSEMSIPKCMLPKVVPSSGIICETSEDILGIKIPISGVAGDQQSALFGQACFEVGSAKNTYGTGCFILMNIGNKPILSKNNLITTIGWVIGDKVEYALEGSVFNAGSAIQWMRDELRLIDSAAQADVEAEKVDDTAGVYVVPAFTGLGAPYWDMFARGTIVGITRGTTREHIIRAVLESIAYQSKDVFDAMQVDSGVALRELRVDGGASVSDFLMQFQTDILNIPVMRPQIKESTAMGAAYLAGLGIGLWSSKEEIAKEWMLQKEFTPLMKKEEVTDKYLVWKKAVERSLNWQTK